MTEALDRECVVCGTDLTIHVADDGTYEGGHYWPNLLEDDDREYWECDDCHTDETGRPPADNTDYQDNAVEIGRNPDHPRLAVQPSPWDTDKLLLWSLHDGEKWTEGTYLRADEARHLADVLTTLADGLESDESDWRDGFGAFADSDNGHEEPDDDRHRDYYSENPGWADDLPSLGENG